MVLPRPHVLDQLVNRVTGTLADRHHQSGIERFGQLRPERTNLLELPGSPCHLRKRHPEGVFLEKLDDLIVFLLLCSGDRLGLGSQNSPRCFGSSLLARWIRIFFF